MRRYKYKYRNSCLAPSTKAIKVGKRSAHKSHLAANNPVSFVSKKNHVIDDYFFEELESQSLEQDDSSSLKPQKKEGRRKHLYTQVSPLILNRDENQFSILL